MRAVKAAEFLRQLERVIAQDVGRTLGFRRDHDIGLGQKLQRQSAFFGRMDGGGADGIAFCLCLAQYALYTDGCILQIRAGLAFEFRETLQIEDVIGGAVIGEVSEFDCRQADLAGDLGFFPGAVIIAQPLLGQAGIGFHRGHGDQVIEFHGAAGAGLERLAVLPVHGAIADMFQHGFAIQPGLVGGAEHLFKMAMLAVIHHIKDQIGIIIAHPFDHRGEVGGAIQHAAFRLDQDQRWHRLFVAVFSNGHDQRALAHFRKAARFQIVEHGRDQIMDAGFAVPQIKMHAQAGEFTGDTRLGHFHEMLPQSAIAGAAILQRHRGAAGQVQPGRVGFAIGRSGGVNFFQIFHRHRRNIRVRTFEGGVEIDRRQAAQFHFGNQLAHLQAPIAQMHVADDAPAIGAIQPLQAVADDGGAQMMHRHGLGDIGTAEIDHQLLAVIGRGAGLRQQRRQRRVAKVEIDETGTGDLDPGEARIFLQPRHDLFRDGAGVCFRSFRRRQRAIALELAQIRAVGLGDLAEMRRQAFRREGLAQARRQVCGDGHHGLKRPRVAL